MRGNYSDNSGNSKSSNISDNSNSGNTNSSGNSNNNSNKNDKSTNTDNSVSAMRRNVPGTGYWSLTPGTSPPVCCRVRAAGRKRRTSVASPLSPLRTDGD